jgi:hypothetical protein
MKSQSAGVAQLGNWYAVAAVAAASFGLAAGAQEADAAPVIVHPIPGPVTAPAGVSGPGIVGFNLLDTTGTQYATDPPDIVPPASINVAIEWGHSSHGAGGALVVTEPGVALTLVAAGHSPGSHYAVKLGGGAAIDSATFHSGRHARSSAGLGATSSGGAHVGEWHPGDTGFIGLAALNSSGQILFGWAEIHLASNFDPTLIAWGFNSTAGAPDFTPSLPEPGSLLLLASGAAGLAAYRRRRAQRRAAAA